MATDTFRFRIRKAPGNPHATVEAFKASPAFTTITNAVAGKPETVGTVYVSYKLYEGAVWVRYDFDDEDDFLKRDDDGFSWLDDDDYYYYMFNHRTR